MHPWSSCPPIRPYLPALVAEELAGVLDDLLVRHVGVGLLPAQREGLPQRHSERPHVAGRCELALARGSRAGSGMGFTQKSQVLGDQNLILDASASRSGPREVLGPTDLLSAWGQSLVSSRSGWQ